nr:3765_t:CDS:2 [Entrophospora candida]
MGVEIQTIKEGDGKGSTVVIEYVGKLTNGKIFDQNKNFECKIGVGQLIAGIPRLRVGEKAILTISPDYGYKEAGVPGREVPSANIGCFPSKLHYLFILKERHEYFISISVLLFNKEVEG